MSIEVPVGTEVFHPDDRCLLRLPWVQKFSCSYVSSFRIRSAPKIFTVVTDGLQWVARMRGISYLGHYFDDFIIIGAPNNLEWEHILTFW